MTSIFGLTFYVLSFVSVYVQVFLLVTFIENRRRIFHRDGATKLIDYKAVTVIVPCWNEEKTVEGTIESLLALNYPKDKLNIFIIDDGSTDGTWDVISKFSSIPNVKIFKKENGGKHTALNLGLEHTKTDFIGCLDADSFVHKEALSRIMSYFEKDDSIMAVAPSIIVNNPKGLIQKAQKAEYYMSVYVKKMLAFLSAIHVTPGPLTIFKKKVFDNLGPYRKAHNTEDMEIAYRMQRNHYRIEQCNDAYIYTNTPATIPKLYKQRLRWIYGFINNTIDYRDVLMKKKYGNFAIFTVPAGVMSILAVSYLFGRVVYMAGDFIYNKILHIKTIGWHFGSSWSIPDLFFFNTNTIIFVTIFLYSLVLISISLGYRIARSKSFFSLDVLYYLSVYSIVAPFWLLRAVYNTITSKKPSWR